MADSHAYFSVLGLEPGASFETVRQSYRHLVKIWHPDRFFHNSEFQRVAHDKLTAINQAYEELSLLFSRQPSQPDPPSPAATGPEKDPTTQGFSSGAPRPSPSKATPPSDGKCDPRTTGTWLDLEEDLESFSLDTDGRRPRADGSRNRAFPPEVIWRYRQAAEQGFDNAQFELGMIYLQGNGVSRDLVEAYKWLALATAAKGRVYLKAEHYLERVRACLTREQMTEASSRMAPFTSRRSDRS